MDIKEKIIQLIEETDGIELYASELEDIADNLIANGVTVQEWISVKDRLPPHTNADRIRAMSDDELAEFLEGDYGNMITGTALQWLKQPTEE